MTTSITDDQPGKGWFVFLGIVMILTGIAAIAFPFVASLSVELLAGGAFLVGGIATLFQAFQEKEWGGVIWQLVVGIVYVLGGIAFLANPFGGVVALTVVLGAVFLVEGIARIVMGFQMRGQPKWGWVVASGAMSVLLGLLVFGGLANGASLGLIGVILGLNFIVSGAAFFALGNAKSVTIVERTA